MPSKKNWFPQNYIFRISWPKSQFFQAWATDCQQTGATDHSEMVRCRRRRTRTVKVRTALFRRQTADSIFLSNPDRIQTYRHRTQNPDRIQTADGHLTNSRQADTWRKSGQNPDSRQTPDRILQKIWTKTRQGYGQRCRLCPRGLVRSPYYEQYYEFQDCTNTK